MSVSASQPLATSTRVLAGAFVASGALHLVRPRTYEPLMPAWVPAHREVIVGSGVVELVCAVGLLHPRTRRAAGWASVAVLLGVYPANLQMVRDALRSDSTGFKAAAFARLPLQIPMIRAALRATRG